MLLSEIFDQNSKKVVMDDQISGAWFKASKGQFIKQLSKDEMPKNIIWKYNVYMLDDNERPKFEYSIGFVDNKAVFGDQMLFSLYNISEQDVDNWFKQNQLV